MSQIINNNFWLIQILIQIFAVLLGTSLAYFGQKNLLKKLLTKFQKTPLYWDDAIVKAARLPLNILVWFIGSAFIAKILASQKSTITLNILGTINIISTLGIILLFTWFLIRFINHTEKNTIDRKQNKTTDTDHTIQMVAKLSKIFVFIVACITIVQILGYNPSGIVALGGAGGLVIGFAAKDLLANFFGGIMIYLDRPFAIGNWIRSPDREIEGTVESIGWRITQIRTFDMRPLYIPNSIFSTIIVENPSRMTNRRIYETIGIRYNDMSKVSTIIDAVKNMLENHKDIDPNKTLIVNFDKCAPSSLDFFVYTFTKTTNWIKFHAIKQDVILQILKIIEEHGATTAFPTQTLHIEEETLAKLDNQKHTTAEIESS